MGLLKNMKQRFKKDDLQLDPNLFTQKEIELFNAIREFTISDRIYNYYRTNINNNLDETKEAATKKLIKNMMLARKSKIDKESPFFRMFSYGNLSILVDFKSKKIIWLNNARRVNTHFGINKNKEKELYRVLGIIHN